MAPPLIILLALAAAARAAATSQSEPCALAVKTESRTLPFPRGCRCASIGPPSIDRRLNISLGGEYSPAEFVILRALVRVASSPDLHHDALRLLPATEARRGCAAAALGLRLRSFRGVDGAPHVLLSGAASPGEYARCLRAVSYDNTAEPPAQVPGARVVVYSVWGAVPAAHTGAAQAARPRVLTGSGRDTVLLVEEPRYDCWLYCSSMFREPEHVALWQASPAPSPQGC